jgi:succinyl-CoA synthetase beta subunit
LKALSEAQTKTWLREHGLPVPWGTAAQSAQEALASQEAYAGRAVVKAMIPTGRRGKAGAVIMADQVSQRASAAEHLLDKVVNGHAVRAVYLEERIEIDHEYFLSFSIDDGKPKILLNLIGGIDIEEIAHNRPGSFVRDDIDIAAGITSWTATELWLRAGASGKALTALSDITCRLFAAFRKADAMTLEINPLASDKDGRLHIVGAMMGIDDNALFRHPGWSTETSDLPDNPRERAVAIANRQFKGGEAQYIELDGNIGLLVGGGGAGLYIHDMVVLEGGAPANHCVTPPTSNDNRKLKAVLNAIFDKPGLKGLLIGFNFAQMARTDIRVRTLVELLDEKQIDTANLPIVIRLFGAGEQESRQMVAGHPNIHYLPRGATLRDAVQLIVRLTSPTTIQV